MAGRGRPLWFRPPVAAGPPSLRSESVGFTKLVARPATHGRLQVNVLDSHDARLLRAGITVAHRRFDDGPGEWYVAAPDWPGLPDEASYPLDGTGELPEEVRRRLGIFLRGEALGPFATLDCARKDYVLRGPDADVLDIRDEVCTVTVDGETRSRTREITMTPRAKLQPQQRDFLVSALAAADASPLPQPPTLQQRIGPPATGLTSFRAPTGFRGDMTLEEFVSETLLGDLHALVMAELLDDRAEERDAFGRLLLDLRGLSLVVDPSWEEALEHDVRAFTVAPREDRQVLLPRIIEALVGGVRAPRLGDHGADDARVELCTRVERSLMILFDRCRALEVDGPDEAWLAAMRSAPRLPPPVQLAEPLFRKPARKLSLALGELADVLRASVPPPEDIELVGLSVEEAFRLGRDVEHARAGVLRARAELISSWPERVAQGRKALKKLWRRAT